MFSATTKNKNLCLVLCKSLVLGLKISCNQVSSFKTFKHGRRQTFQDEVSSSFKIFKLCYSPPRCSLSAVLVVLFRADLET